MSVNWRQYEICIVINDRSQGWDGLLHYKFISQFAGERICKISEHLAELEAKWLIVPYTSHLPYTFVLKILGCLSTQARGGQRQKRGQSTDLARAGARWHRAGCLSDTRPHTVLRVQPDVDQRRAGRLGTAHVPTSHHLQREPSHEIHRRPVRYRIRPPRNCNISILILWPHFLAHHVYQSYYSVHCNPSGIHRSLTFVL